MFKKKEDFCLICKLAVSLWKCFQRALARLTKKINTGLKNVHISCMWKFSVYKENESWFSLWRKLATILPY